MTSDRLKLLSSSEVIRDKLDDIIEAFVAFYGEERREEITYKLKNILIIKFCSVDSLNSILDRIKKGIIKDVLNFDENQYIYIGPESLMEILEKGKDNYFSDEDKKLIIGEVLSNEEIHKRYKEGKYPKLEEIVKKYNSIIPILKPYEELYEKEANKVEKIEKKYYKKLVEEFLYLFSEEEQQTYIKYETVSPLIWTLVGSTVNKRGNCFDDENENILNDENAPSWKKESIAGDRNRILKKTNLSKEELRVACEKLTKRQEELYRLQSIEITESLEDYQKCRKEIEEKHYVNKNDPLGPFTYQSPVSCCHENYIIKDGKYVLYPLILINANMSDIDVTVIHELNHALEMHTLSIDEKGTKSICGWDYDQTEFKNRVEYNELEYSGITRGNELISEYVNDRLAQEITDVLHNQGKYIFFKERSNDTSGYMIAKVLLEDFYQQYKETIIKSRSNGNIELLYEKVGKENFEELNDLVNELYNTFGLGFAIYSALASYKNKEDTEEAQKIEELVARRDQILAKMNEYARQRTK